QGERDANRFASTDTFTQQKNGNGDAHQRIKTSKWRDYRCLAVVGEGGKQGVVPEGKAESQSADKQPCSWSDACGQRLLDQEAQRHRDECSQEPKCGTLPG